MKTIITLIICKLFALMSSRAYCHTASGIPTDTETPVTELDTDGGKVSADSALLMSVDIDWDDIRDNVDDRDDYDEYWKDDRDD